jgi:hypothetical protein
MSSATTFTRITSRVLMKLVCEKFQENRRDLRRKVAALLFLLKDRVSPEDLFTNLSGHSSSS